MPQPVRVVFACSSYYPRYAGASVYIHHFIPFLANYGVHSSILTRAEPGQPAVDQIDGVRVWRTGDSRRQQLPKLRTAIAFTLHLVRFRKQYDLVHFASGSLYSQFCAPFLKAHHIPFVIETVLFSEDDAFRLRKARLGRLRLWAMKQANAIFTISKALCESYTAEGFSEQRVRLLPYGVDTTRFYPVHDQQEKDSLRYRLSLPLSAPIAVFIGGVNQRKGIDFLVEVWTTICDRLPEARLLLVGPNDQSGYQISYGRSVRNRIKQLGLDKNVVLCGYQPNTEEYLRAADIYISASRNEGLGIAVLEGMSCGLPAVTNYLPGVSETLFGEEMLLSEMAVRSYDTEIFAARLIQIFNDNQYRAWLGGQARDRVKRQFDITQRAQDFARIYAEILAYGEPGNS